MAVANSNFRMLTNDFVHARCKEKRNPSNQAQHMFYSSARKSAKALWHSLVQSDLWSCEANHSHGVELSLQEEDSTREGSIEDGVRTALSLTMLTYGSPVKHDHQQPVGKVVEAIPAAANVSRTGAVLEPQRKDIPIAGEAPESHDRPSTSSRDKYVSDISKPACAQTDRKLSDICSELFLSPIDVHVGHEYGFVECRKSQGYRHDLRFLRCLWGERQKTSLRAALFNQKQTRPILDVGSLGLWTNKLSVAISLAISSLVFQGNWLREPWDFDDFVVVEEELGPEYVSSARLFLERLFPDCLVRDRDVDMTGTTGDSSKTLLPLGLALVELVVSRPLAELRDPEDAGLSEREAELKAAKHLLDYVLLERGFTYRSVVEKCLFWDDMGLDDLDDEQVQMTVYQDIIQPLARHLCAIRGYTPGVMV